MPAQPAWFHRLEEILSVPRSMTSTRLDRLAVEKLFRVCRRRARQIMADLEGLRAGNAPRPSLKCPDTPVSCCYHQSPPRMERPSLLRSGQSGVFPSPIVRRYPTPWRFLPESR